MADHMRTQLRARLATLLTGLASTDDRVYPGRRQPIQGVDLPCWCIYTEEEQSDHGSMGGILERQVVFVAKAVTKSVDQDVDDDLDQLALEGETAIGADPKLNGLAVDCVLIGSDPVRAADETAAPHGGIELRYRVTYETTRDNPGESV